MGDEAGKALAGRKRRTTGPGLVLALLIGCVFTACGSGGPGGPEGSDSTSAGGGPVERPYDTAQQAAMGFSGWFQADATDCSEPHFILEGRLPQRWLDAYSCRAVLSAAEFRDHCEPGPLFASGAPHSSAVKLDAGRTRFTIAWGRTLHCAGKNHSDKGTYQVVVQKYADGWSVTSYKILAGPGAGTSG
ncbi:hypothetical protein GCM10028801_30040 [Nocardioides maradonensis]